MNKQLMILLTGRIITNFADSFYMIATIWYVKSATSSPLLIGLTSAVAILPVTIQFLYGPIIDRFSKKKILFVAMLGQGALVSVISILYYTNLLWLPLLLTLMFVALSLSECTYPTESALIESLTPREQLTRVNSIFAFSYQTLDIICDAVSGILIAFVGLGLIYVTNSILLLGTGLLFLFYLNVPRSTKETELRTVHFIKQYKDDFKDGFQVVKKRYTLLSVVFGIIGMNVMATMGISMLPVISESSADYGFWLTAMSLGTLTGTVLSSKVEKIALNRILPLLSLWSGMCWMLAFALKDLAILPYLLFAISWMGIGVIGIYVQTLIQVNLPEGYIGIGFAFISSLLGSLSPLGYLLGGVIGEFTSGRFPLVISGVGYLVFALYFRVNPKLRNLNKPLSVRFEDS
ncbi:MFS transporter [Rossellomorea sp. SC111]|uniref:MFS transporter n=1 Tax=Rossellomorea sp. SC111 TaxID=2968985 RepID=UPI00215B31AC|nr:MFS transporter [Rossellomorea sp. SC111]MCR8851043.1 MFS transporter [Rossellomorea sp. SC111]